MSQALNLETIAAIATPPGTGGIAIIRISGSAALSIAQKLTDLKQIRANQILPAFFYSAAPRQKLDRVLVSFFKAPDSYTGEDTIEINCHGSVYLANKILSSIIQAGARLAEPGEFTKRAFLSGKIDLTQAEAVAELLASRTALSSTLAFQHLEGNLSKALRELGVKVEKLTAEIEASVDFPEEVAEPQHKYLQTKILELQQNLETIYRNSEKGLLIKNGINIVIAGRTNVGKSSLFNALAGEYKAIITEIHGTTRDALEAEISLQGIRAVLVDTAGIRTTRNKIEKIGIGLAQEYIAKADLVLYLVEATEGLTTKDKKILAQITNKNILFVINKTELRPSYKLTGAVKISAKTGAGLSQLEHKIIQKMDLEKLDFNKNIYLGSQRQKEKIYKILEIIRDLLLSLKKRGHVDLLSIDLKKILTILKEISGEKVSAETIDNIFENFCVGK